MLVLVRYPRAGVPHARDRVLLQARVHVHVVVVDRGGQRHLVGGEAGRVVELRPVVAAGHLLHGAAERAQQAELLEHPGVHHLAGEQQRPGGRRERRVPAALPLGGPRGGGPGARRVDALLHRREQRVRRVRGEAHHLGEQHVGRLAAVVERLVEERVDPLAPGRHAEVDADRLQALHGEHVAVGQRHVADLEPVREAGQDPHVGRVARVVADVLPDRARVGPAVDLLGVGVERREAARHVAGRQGLRRERQGRAREEPAVALAERRPAAPALEVLPQRLCVLHDRVGAEQREVPGGGRVVVAEPDHRARRHGRAPPGAALVEEHDAVRAEGVADPPAVVEHARRLPARAALEVEERGQVVAAAVGRDELAGEHRDRRGGLAGARRGPVERDLDLVVGDVDAGDGRGSDDHAADPPAVSWRWCRGRPRRARPAARGPTRGRCAARRRAGRACTGAAGGRTRRRASPPPRPCPRS